MTRPTPAEPVPQVREAADALHAFVADLVKPWVEFKGHEGHFAEIISEHTGRPSDAAAALISRADRYLNTATGKSEWASYILRDMRNYLRALTARPSDAPVSSTAAEMLVLADEFEGEAKAHGAMGDKDERTKCLRAAYALRHLALPPDESAHVIDDSVEKACAAYLADVPLDGRHSDAAGGNAYEIVAWAQEELAHFRSQLEPARVTPSGGQPEIHSSDGGVETQTHHGAAAAPITNVKAGVASGPSEQECGGVFVGGGVMYPDSNDPHDWAKAFCGRLGMWRRTEYGNTVDIGDQVGIMERWFTAAMSRGAKP